MSFPRYNEYKDSGVEWLGEVPAHWDVVPLRRTIVSIDSGTSVNAIDTPATDGELGVLKTSCVYRGTFDPHENKAVLPEEHPRVSCPIVAGSLIVSRMNTPDLVGAAGLVESPVDGLYLPDRLWQVRFGNADPAFVHRWTQSPAYRAQVQMVCAGASSSMQNLSQDDFRAFLLPSPPPPEQTAIAAFLDRETAKIDDLVAEQQNLIALLKEKRQALISHAVTKGLNPNAPMKDSGVEWLGEVPAHWETRRVKTLFEICKRIVGEVGFDVLSITQRGIRVKDIESGDGQLSMDYSKYQLVEVGDFAMNHMDLLTGYVDVSPSHGVTSPDYRVFRLREPQSHTSRYFLYVFQHAYKRKIFFPYGQGSSQLGRWRLPTDEFNAFGLPCPSRAEQIAIATLLDRETAKIDDLMAEAESTITLLQERRTALIAAAVTGRIDVRNVVARKEEAAT